MWQLYACILCCLWLCSAALLPTVCVSNVTNDVAVCCPTPRGFAAACGGRGRGECVRIQAYRDYEKYHPAVVHDDRMMWPTRFFQFGCQCDAKFWGPDCGECFFGWKGKDCREKDVRIRRNIFTLTPKQRLQYREIGHLTRRVQSPYSVLIERHNNASDPLRNPRFVTATVHYWLVFVHRYASRKTLFTTPEQCSKFGKLDLNHGGPGFITWHRYYTLLLERELLKLAEAKFGWTDFALPYWDWVDATWCEVCHNDLVGGPGDCDQYGQRVHEESPFAGWDEFCSSPANSSTGGCVGCHAQDRFNKLARQWSNLALPTTEEVQYALNIEQYYIPGEFDADPADAAKCSFSRFLEGHCGPKKFAGNTGTLHNKVHDSVQGSFCCAATAPNDPIFFLHHSQISRIVQMWFARHKPHQFALANTDTVPGHSRQNYMVGFYPPIRHQEIFADSLALGYTYDTFEYGEPVRRRLQARGLIPTPTLRHFTTCRPGFLHPQHRLHQQHFQEELKEFLQHNWQRVQRSGRDAR